MNIELPPLPDDPEELEHHIRKREDSVEHLKPDNRARIVWADPDRKERTSYSVVYLHGFTASQGEGYPVHIDYARRYGLNLYLSRLKGHGIDHPDAFSGLTPQHFIDSAAEALAIGTRLGSRVILMGTSTGASLGIYLASRISDEFLHGLILYAPLIKFYKPALNLLMKWWARPLLRIVPGNNFMVETPIGDPKERDIWYQHYRLEGALALGALIEQTMTEETFANVRLPAMVGYYYRDSKRQDRTVSVSAIQKMFHNLGTEPELKKSVNFPGAGTHVICSSLLSKSVDKVENETFHFSEKVLALFPL